MKIGIDAKWFFEGPVSNQVVMRNLVEGMAADTRGHELFFFLNRKHRNRPFPFSGGQVHKVYVWGGNNMLSNLFLLPFLGRKLGLDGILYQNFGSFFGPRRWVYIHDVIFLQFPGFFSLAERIYFSLIPFLTRFAHRIITISAHEQERILRYGLIQRENCTFFHHGKEEDFLPAALQNHEKLKDVKNRYFLPDVFLLYTGRINARKNLLILLDALEEIQDAPPLVLVGSQDWKNEKGIAARMNVLSQKGKLISAGKVPFADLPAIMCQARLFCFPSLAEGFGLPVLEAMASGVPVLCSRDSAMTEVCGEAAMPVDPRSKESVKTGIRRLLEDETLRSDLSAAGIERASAFSWKKTCAGLLDWLGKQR